MLRSVHGGFIFTAGFERTVLVHWILAASALLRLRRLPDGRRLTRVLLDRSSVTVIVGPRPPYFLRRWRVREAGDVSNPTRICQTGGRFPPRVSFVLLDLEHWRYTPRWAQDHPLRAARCMARAARRRGLGLIPAPALDLMLTRRWRSLRGPLIARDIRSRLAPRLARYAAAYELQSQGLEFHPRRYARAVATIVRAVHAVRSGLPVYAGLSTNPRGPRVTLALLKEDIRLTRADVVGYWLNVPAPGGPCPRCRRPRPALALRLISAEARSISH